jgi:TolA-binding protein
VVNLARAESVISEIPSGTADSEAVAPVAPSPEPQPAAEKPAMPSPTSSSLGKTGGERRWSEQLARGHWDRILAEANRMGIDNTLAKASSEDLFALADAARYRRNPELARSALLAEQRRFPNSARALDAIFLLGRVEELREQGATQAVARYNEYLTRAPAGPFVGEALGRKMTLTDRLEGPASARPVAEEYLRRFPKGNYAGAARTLLRAP